MNFKRFLSDPKVMAASGWIAMFLKSALCVSISMLISFLAKYLTHNPDLNRFMVYQPFMVFILYPPIGLTVDLLLHVNRKKIWKWSPDPISIPIEWKMNSEALLNYAVNGPKVRLMRLVACWTPVTVAMMPFTPFDASMLLKIILGFGLGFFFFALFDRLWASVLNIKIPSLLTQFKSFRYSTIMLAQALASWRK